MTKKDEFVLKDSPPELISAAGVEPKGRTYDVAYERKPGAVRIEDVLLGTKLACVAITDDKPDTLKNVGKMNPWHVETLTMITGSAKEAHKPLTEILDRHFDLKLDKMIDLSGWAGGHPIDTQGFIAHNDEYVVVSFRCTTSAMDWMTNFAAGSSEWELDIDLPLGHSGWCSCFEGRILSKKPRVHTGFYNNILKTIPLLKEHVDPLLAKDQPPRKLYVVGHSLGAGMSTMATCYFLLNHDWEELPQKLINVSCGTPRSCTHAMADLINKKLDDLRPLDKAVVARVVMNNDIVARVPPRYADVGKLVFLTEDGYVLIGPKRSDSHIINEKEMKQLSKKYPELKELQLSVKSQDEEDEQQDPNEAEEETLRKRDKARIKYENAMAKMPGAARDHCPDKYLEPLLKLYNRQVSALGDLE